MDRPPQGELPGLGRLGRIGLAEVRVARKKLILDVDTGTDGAVAMMLAAVHPDLALLAATTVNGNNPLADR
jgi:RecB family exonuclease